MQTRTDLLILTANIEDLADRRPGLITVTQAEMRSVMSVPLISRDKAIGALHYRSRKSYTSRRIIGKPFRIANTSQKIRDVLGN
jgi:hypothetical protein